MELEFLSTGQIIVRTLAQFLPVWIGMGLIMGASFVWRRRLGTYGRIYELGIGMIGFGLVLFWLLDGADGALGGAVRSLRAAAGVAEQVAGGDRAGERAALSVRRRHARARRVQPDGLRQPDGDGDRTAGDAVCLHDRHHAGVAGGVFRRLVRHHPELHRQPGAGVSGDPAVLPAGDARDPADGDPRDDGGGVLLLSGAVRDGVPVEPVPRAAGGACGCISRRSC